MLGEAVVAEGEEAEPSVAGAEGGTTHFMHPTHPLQVIPVRILFRTVGSAAMIIITMKMSPSVPQSPRPSVHQSLKMKYMMDSQFSL